MIYLFIIDKQPTFIKGLKAIFEETDCDIRVIGNAGSCNKAMEFLETHEVDVLLLDPSNNESITNLCFEKIKKSNPNLKIVILTNELDINYLNNLWMAGVDGVELKSCGKKALLNAITKVMEGERILGKKIPNFFNKSETIKNNEPRLSLKEKEIYQLMLTINSCEEIAKKLKLPLVAVKFHTKNILKKISKYNFSIGVKDQRKNQLVS